MRHDKDKALELYRSGLSYGVISKQLSVSKSTLSLWFRHESDAQSIRQKNISKRAIASKENLRRYNEKRQESLNALYGRAELEAKNEYLLNSRNPLFIAGICLYWSQGDMVSRNGFRITHSDPRLVRSFIAFLVKYCNVERARIRATISMHPDADEGKAQKYWRDNIFLGKESFTKTIRTKGVNNKAGAGRGACTINYSSTILKRKMLCWIDLAAKGLVV